MTLIFVLFANVILRENGITSAFFFNKKQVH